MSDITLITSPDRLYTNEYSFLLIYPSSVVKEQFQNFLARNLQPFHVYLYENKEHDVDWLLEVFVSVDTVIIDIDNCEKSIRDLASYFLSRSKTYWLTNGTGNYYNNINKNRIFDLDFLDNRIGGQIGKSESE